MKKVYAILLVLFFSGGLNKTLSQTTLIGPLNGGNFDLGGGLAGNNWTPTKNQVSIPADGWVASTAAGATSGTQAAYVSSNPLGGPPPYTYTFNTRDSLILARMATVTFPANQSCITLSFQWKCMGENDVSNTDLDNLKVYLIPKAGPITTNDIQPNYQIGAVYYNGSNAWNPVSFNLDPKLAGNLVNYTLAFLFVSDGLVGTSANPPAAIDDVVLTHQAPTATPSCPVYTSPNNGASGLSPCLVSLNWNHSLGCNGATSYQIWYSTVFGGPYINAGTTSQNTFNLTSLLPTTTYYWYILPINSFGTNNTCVPFKYSFTTSTNPVVSGLPPYFEDFESCNNWTMYNAGQTNQWYVGNATSAGGTRALYISNTLGANNTYNTGSTSIVHAMSNTTIDLTGGGSCINLAFTYRSGGELLFDWFDVIAVPVGYTPVAGAAIATGAVGGVLPNLSNPVLIAGPFNLQTSYLNYTASLNALAGRQFKLVFSWRNDNSLGLQPPAAIDNISITSTGGPANDLPCNASFIPPLSTAGLYLPGSNVCANNTDEPAAPACWTNSNSGQINTVWFRFTAPASGCVKMRTERGSLYDTQIALYRYNVAAATVPCGSGNTLILVTCNDNRPGCGSSSYLNSEISASGLTPGYNYYIAVDGKNAQVGTFSLFIMDAGGACNIPYPPTPGADCASPNLVCSSNTFVPNPGYQGFGANCDFTGGICLASGDRGGAWYQVNTIGAGNLAFDIVPNDWTGFSSTDYDFAVWKIAGSGTLATCASIFSSPATGLVRCNYSALGVTGCYGAANGISPPAYPGYGGAYQAQIPVVANETYYIYVSNFGNSTSGFTLYFTYTTPSAAAVIAAGAVNGGSITWTGTVSSSWTDPNNWGGCAVPSCQGGTGETDALISSLYVNPPIITGSVSCRNLTINPGATLTIAGTGVLEVCRNFTNNGSFNAQVGSRVLLDGPAVGTYTGTQNLDGNLTGANGFYHLDVSKASTSNLVISNQDFDVKGNFKIGYNTGSGTTNTTTYFESAPGGNGKYVKVGGDFLVYQVPAGATSTFNVGGGSVLEFNGGANQNYMNRNLLGDVYVNQSPISTVTVQPHGGTGFGYMTLGSAGNLIFNSGKIVLPGSVSNAGIPTSAKGYVEVQNPAASAISGQNPNSYISGPGVSPFYVLKKVTTGALGSYDLPVGTAAKYGNVNLNVSTILSPSPSFFLVGFDNTAPASNPAFTGGSPDECSIKYHSGGAVALNNGNWRILLGNAAVATAGKMDVTLSNRGYSNPNLGQTVMFNKLNTPLVAANWAINPIPANPCIPPSNNPDLVSRLNMNWTAMNPASTTIPLILGSAQGPNPLPVELLFFNAKGLEKSIQLDWSTASEKNNSGFEIQRSTGGNEYERIGWVEGNGTTTYMHTYRFNDNNVLPGIIYYYRLKQIDFDGLYELSRVVAASISDDRVSFAVSPNPYSGQTNISYRLDQTSDVILEVVNKLGQKIATVYKGAQEPGVYTYPFSAKKYGFSSGVYTVRITINDQIYTRRLFEND